MGQGRAEQVAADTLEPLLRAVPNVASTALSGASDAAGKAVVALRSADSFSAKLVDRGYGWVGDLAGVVGSWFKFW